MLYTLTLRPDAYLVNAKIPIIRAIRHIVGSSAMDLAEAKCLAEELLDRKPIRIETSLSKEDENVQAGLKELWAYADVEIFSNTVEHHLRAAVDVALDLKNYKMAKDIIILIDRNP